MNDTTNSELLDLIQFEQDRPEEFQNYLTLRKEHERKKNKDKEIVRDSNSTDESKQDSKRDGSRSS